MVPAPQENRGGNRPGLRKGHLSQQWLQLGGETLAKAVLPSAFCSGIFSEKIFSPGLFFFDDSFTGSLMPAFHFNDSIAVKPSHVKA